MRWQGQQVGATDAAALPGMERLEGLVRTVTTPEFAGITFHEVACKSALNRVPGASAMPFAWTVNPYRGCTHACAYCVSSETMVLMADGREKPIGHLAVGDEIVGTRSSGKYRRYVRTTVEAVWSTRKRAYRVTLADGTEVVASGDHRFLTSRGWKHVTGRGSGAGQRPYLTTSNSLQGFGSTRAAPILDTDRDYRRGYLSGMIRGDGMIFHREYAYPDRARSMHLFRLALADDEALDRTRRLLSMEGIATHTRPFSTATTTRRSITALHTARRASVAAIEALIAEPEVRSREWLAGFLGGIFDAEGSCSNGVIRISNKDPGILRTIAAAMTAFDIPWVLEPTRTNGVASIRVRGGMPTRMRFFGIALPAITRRLSILGTAVKTVADLHVTSIEDLGEEMDMVDITTGTGDFIANGVISHNCFARQTHTYLDLDAGRDFDSQIVVKVNVAEVLAREVRRGSWVREHVALGTNTDPYQRAEGRYRLMPGIIEALASSGTPMSILTKGTLLRRDLPLLRQAREAVDVSLATSIAVFDDDLQHRVEPGTPTAQARLDTVRAATDAGFRVTVFLMPVLPYLTDSIAALDDALRRIKESGAVRVVYGALHLRPGAKQWFLQWLSRERPDLVSSYAAMYPGVSATAPKEYRRLLARRIRPLMRAHGLDGGAEEDADAPPRARPAFAPVARQALAEAPRLF